VQVLRWFAEGGTIGDFQALAVALLPLGIGIIYAALRRRYFLVVQTEGDTRKLVFHKAATRDDVQRFASTLGAHIEVGPGR
jgi:hypothetical protein